MRLTKRAIELINTPDNRRELSNKKVLDCTEQSVIKYIRKNENNGPLTLYVALKRIEELTGLLEKEILEEVTTEETQLQN